MSTVACPSCQTLNRAGAKFCAYCGTPLPQMPSSPAPAPPPPIQPRHRTKIGGLIAALVLACIWLVLAIPVGLVSGQARTATTPVDLHPRDAGQRGLDWLLRETLNWPERMQRERGYQCYGCHVQSFAVLGGAISSRNGYRVRTEDLDTIVEYILHFARDGVIQDADTARHIHSTALAAFALSHYTQDIGPRHKTSFLQMANWLLTEEQGDGHWVMDRTGMGPGGEPPVDQGDAGDTAYASWAISTANRIASNSQYTQALERAGKWFRQTSFKTTQDTALTIVGMKACGFADNDPDVRRVVSILKTHQRPDGGWGETESLRSNAYATGQVLYALRLAGEGVQQEYFRNGVIWLLRHQESDGSWDLRPSQTTRPSRFAATMWAVVGIGEIFDVQTEREFLSLIHAGQRTGTFTLPGITLFLCLLLPMAISLILLRPRRLEPTGGKR